MNKKIKYGLLIPLFALVLISAGLIVYYDRVSQDLEVVSPISMDSATEKISAYPMHSFQGEVITISNDAPHDIEVGISNDAETGIEVSYMQVMDMEIKDSSWVTQSVGAKLYYTIIGNQFTYKTEAVNEYNLTDYVVVYYPDSTGNPGPWNIGSAIVLGGASSEIAISDLDQSLPISSDFNDRAKLWLMPSSDVEVGWDNEMLNRILFEHDLITYTDAETGTITIPGEGTVELIPVYNIGLYEGNVTVTTSANPIA